MTAPTITQADIDASAKYDAINPYADDAEFDAVFAAHRKLGAREAVADVVAYLREQANHEEPFRLDPMAALGLPLSYAAAAIECGEHLSATKKGEG